MNIFQTSPFFAHYTVNIGVNDIFSSKAAADVGGITQVQAKEAIDELNTDKILTAFLTGSSEPEAKMARANEDLEGQLSSILLVASTPRM